MFVIVTATRDQGHADRRDWGQGSRSMTTAVLA
ncbi:hypothetical protein FOQG_07959 [Fusarium oxysporum f. sp. raphani 54005]|uniref:Uncharacterized protein n=8 Tax=Fusarium oxysporum TaxID=5507 RepID=W9IHW5_FUSOX|nr:hypothetical protein FOXG_17818 [Fusarium oxysporum f. sp. lycopersici 4287]EWY94528.1 hypothetical protein FOYG_07219 [Fusarium oxysporum NRRL 32931]EWZ50160.1 hypothetical protein FOZG_00813 [Fusarium oxysporum Fo47]EWZ92368.1 hypothetical protein FOWG_07515 [Fusarium oxysporum f. sp. lycopersici MN25]EXA53610.1 hypothetical protein FOVG_01365 [Fusarium oxysporum f. sp. pisi HDV247]EXK47405.1 hypothetical protein FOMG_00816 [Fusarium oxysporum f. sp. melonis 26406]EXK89332.1 hypothetical